MKGLPLETKILLLKLVNKKSMNKSSSENVLLRLQFFTLLQVAGYRDVFRTRSNIYIRAFSAKILNEYKVQCSTGLKVDFWFLAKGLKY